MVKTKFLVADTAAFIKLVQLNDICENVITVQEVIAEIKDRQARERLQFMPLAITYKSPAPKYLKKVAEIAKLSGDYASLSVTDIKVLALAYQMQCEHDCDPLEGAAIDAVGERIRNLDKVQHGSGGVGSQDLNMPGFYMPKSGKADEENEDREEKKDEATDHNSNFDENCEPSKEDFEQLCEELTIGAKLNDEEENNGEDINNDDEGWITPAKFRQMEVDEEKKRQKEGEKEILVACMTTDYAMQNVLMKMKLKVLGVDGLLIYQMRNYVLRCYGCFKTTSKMDKKFCPSCGHPTLKRVAVEVQEDGSLKMFLSRNPNKVLSKRGKKFSLPTPRGGKHAVNPILCEHQRIPHNRPNKKALAAAQADVWADDYESRSSPFAINDVHSQAFRLGVSRNNQRNSRNRNPNAVAQKFAKRR